MSTGEAGLNVEQIQGATVEISLNTKSLSMSLDNMSNVPLCATIIQNSVLQHQAALGQYNTAHIVTTSGNPPQQTNP